MTNLEIFTQRYSCRSFENKAISQENLKQILEFARLSPSSLGLEPWKFFVISDEKKKEQIAEISNKQQHVKEASVLIIIASRLDFAEYFESKLRQRKMSEAELNMRLNTYKPFLESMDAREKLAYSREQAHIALSSILYGANALGIATCTIGGFDKAKLDAYLNLDTSKIQSTLIVALGYSKESQIPQKARFAFDEVVELL